MKIYFFKYDLEDLFQTWFFQILTSVKRGSASGTGSPGSRGPGPKNLRQGLEAERTGQRGLARPPRKSGTGTGTQNKKIRDPVLGPRYWDLGINILFLSVFPQSIRYRIWSWESHADFQVEIYNRNFKFAYARIYF